MLIESFHAGPHGRRRYCSLHRPATRLIRSTGVVICYPLGHEYFRAHRAFVKLGERLARLGFPVLRFDYVGTGDSEGDCGHNGVDVWLDDIAQSAGELQRRERVTEIALCGLRFGAALAMLAASRIDALRTLLLWEPVEDGVAYLHELRHLHDRMLADLERFPRVRRDALHSADELVGVRYGERFLSDVKTFKAGTLTLPGVENVIVASRGETGSHWQRMTRLNEFRVRDYGWNDVHRIEEAIVDPGGIERMSTSIEAVAA